MKKKILLSIVMIVVIACLFAFAVNAEGTSVHNGKVDLDATVTLDDGTVVNLFDPYGNALIWFNTSKNGLQSIRADDPRVKYKATYGFHVGNNTVGSVYVYEVSDMWIQLENEKISKTSIVVLNLMDDDVKVNEGSSAYTGGPVNCVKTIAWANKVIEYAYLRLDTAAIQQQAFSGCPKLKYINLEDLTELRQIGGAQTFSQTSGSTKLFLGETLDLSNTKLVTLNGEGAFNNVPFVDVKFPSSLTYIENWNLQGTKLVSYAFPTNVTQIRGSQFNDAKLLKEIYINSVTTSIVNRAFNNTVLEKIFYVGTLSQLNSLLDNTGTSENAPFWAVVGENRCNLISYADYMNLADKSGKYVVYDFPYCEAYGHTKGTATSVVNPTCTAEGTSSYNCTVCNVAFTTVIEKTHHNYSVVCNAPTCTEGGDLTRTCSGCDYNKYFELDPNGHNYKKVVTEPTCQNGGYTTYTCTRCNDTYKDSETNATDHKWNGTVCEYNCGATRAAYIGTVSYATFSEAYANANAGDTITLVANITLSEIIKIEKPITLNLGTYTVTSSAKKAFELYADATIINGTIAGACRCIDTRKAVNLTLENVTLIADKYYSEYSNQQPLTIGGNEDGTVVTMNNVTINAGTQGYDITSFVKTTFNATDCTFIGYIGLFVKAGSENSVFNFANCDFTVDISKNDVEGNATALITVEASSVAINLDAESTVTLIGNHTYIAYVADIKTVVVTLPSAYASDVVKSEYAVIDNANGTITVACPHAEAVVVNYIYANGYEAKGICVSKCTVCDVELTSEAPRLFTFLGYSVPENGNGEIAIGFEINKEAIATYESITGYKISYGIFAALESIGTKDIFESGSGAITAAVASTSSAFDFKITGIESAEYKALNMAMGAYVIAEKGAEKTVSYMQGGKPEAEAKYIFVSYDLIASNS